MLPDNSHVPVLPCTLAYVWQSRYLVLLSLTVPQAHFKRASNLLLAAIDWSTGPRRACLSPFPPGNH